MWSNHHVFMLTHSQCNIMAERVQQEAEEFLYKYLSIMNVHKNCNRSEIHTYLWNECIAVQAMFCLSKLKEKQSHMTHPREIIKIL